MDWWVWLIIIVVVVVIAVGAFIALQAKRRAGGVIINDRSRRKGKGPSR